ncbi:MAG: ATP-binding cassette domain-containing protein [Candidatus Omnitrophica bacterium]|nr:ATP-binding cassette domain-containing protein [Candidatus Omnitrophota bacterium]
MIKVEHLSKTLGEQKVLDDISFQVASGEIVAFLGPSGTGKTVLLKHLIGLLKPDCGSVMIDGKDITQISQKKQLEMRKDFGYLFQEGALYDFMNVFENIAFPLREHSSLSEEQICQRVREVLEMVDLHDVETKIPSELSGGMKKRVGLARAIVLGAKVLLCDEPTSGLDPIRSYDISNLIRQVVKKIGATTVITSHDVENSLRIADRIAILNEGHIEVMGTREDLLSCPRPFVKEFLKPSSVAL